MQRHHKKTFLPFWKGSLSWKLRWEFFWKIAFSRQQQESEESILRVKRGKTKAESPSGRSPQTRRDQKKSRTYEEAPANEPHSRCTWTNLRKLDHGQYFLHLHQNATGKNESLQRELNPQQSPQRYQNKKKSSRSLVCWTYWYFIFAKFNTCTPLHIKVD